TPHEPLDGAERILIVVGAHLSAERHDRPLAYTLRERMLELFAQRPSGHESDHVIPEVLVCCDLWYLNDESLKHSPAISIGGPGVNALSAYLASRLPSAFVIDDLLMVQFDAEMHTPLACCWGTTPEATARAVDIFLDKYGDGFVKSMWGA
ncbi:MAG: hypothetical protein H7210_08910, partial [Pyrinomonadaceae bacterium]|nr:hypothetical protein [Phycisphaerales bacterium]